MVSYRFTKRLALSLQYSAFFFKGGGGGGREKTIFRIARTRKSPFSPSLGVSANASVVVIDAFTSNKDPSPAAEL